MKTIIVGKGSRNRLSKSTLLIFLWLLGHWAVAQSPVFEITNTFRWQGKTYFCPDRPHEILFRNFLLSSNADIKPNLQPCQVIGNLQAGRYMFTSIPAGVGFSNNMETSGSFCPAQGAPVLSPYINWNYQANLGSLSLTFGSIPKENIFGDISLVIREALSVSAGGSVNFPIGRFADLGRLETVCLSSNSPTMVFQSAVPLQNDVWEWSYNDAPNNGWNPVNNSASPFIIEQTTSNYTVKVNPTFSGFGTVVPPNGARLRCKVPTCGTAEVVVKEFLIYNTAPLMADFQVAMPTRLCVGEFATLTAPSYPNAKYVWYVDGALDQTQNSNEVQLMLLGREVTVRVEIEFLGVSCKAIMSKVISAAGIGQSLNIRPSCSNDHNPMNMYLYNIGESGNIKPKPEDLAIYRLPNYFNLSPKDPFAQVPFQYSEDGAIDYSALPHGNYLIRMLSDNDGCTDVVFTVWEKPIVGNENVTLQGPVFVKGQTVFNGTAVTVKTGAKLFMSFRSGFTFDNPEFYGYPRNVGGGPENLPSDFTWVFNNGGLLRLERGSSLAGTCQMWNGIAFLPNSELYASQQVTSPTPGDHVQISDALTAFTFIDDANQTRRSIFVNNVNFNNNLRAIHFDIRKGQSARLPIDFRQFYSCNFDSNPNTMLYPFQLQSNGNGEVGFVSVCHIEQSNTQNCSSCTSKLSYFDLFSNCTLNNSLIGILALEGDIKVNPIYFTLGKHYLAGVVHHGFGRLNPTSTTPTSYALVTVENQNFSMISPYQYPAIGNALFSDMYPQSAQLTYQFLFNSDLGRIQPNYSYPYTWPVYGVVTRARESYVTGCNFYPELDGINEFATGLLTFGRSNLQSQPIVENCRFSRLGFGVNSSSVITNAGYHFDRGDGYIHKGIKASLFNGCRTGVYFHRNATSDPNQKVKVRIDCLVFRAIPANHDETAAVGIWISENENQFSNDCINDMEKPGANLFPLSVNTIDRKVYPQGCIGSSLSQTVLNSGCSNWESPQDWTSIKNDGISSLSYFRYNNEFVGTLLSTGQNQIVLRHNFRFAVASQQDINIEGIDDLIDYRCVNEFPLIALPNLFFPTSKPKVNQEQATDAKAISEPVTTRYVDLQGRVVAEENDYKLPPGVYLKVMTTKSTTTKQLIRK